MQQLDASRMTGGFKVNSTLSVSLYMHLARVEFVNGRLRMWRIKSISKCKWQGRLMSRVSGMAKENHTGLLYMS